MASLKKWNGWSWEDIGFKKWNGWSWEKADVFKWNGWSWEKLNEQQYSTTWECNWTQTYRENGTKRTDYRKEKICHGKHSSPWNIMKSMIGFDDANMRATLSGARIDRVELYLHNEHWYYGSGGTVGLGYHNSSGKPNNFNSSVDRVKDVKYSSRGQAMWIDMPVALGNGLRDGSYRGVTAYVHSTSYNYYGVFYGVHDGSKKPKLKITYTKQGQRGDIRDVNTSAIDNW